MERPSGQPTGVQRARAQRSRATKSVLVGTMLVGAVLCGACTSSDAPGAAASIGPGGGTLQSADGTVELKLPAGALSAETNLTIRRADDAPAGHLGPAYEIGPSGTRFSKSVLLRFHYTDQQLAGVKPEHLWVSTVVDGKWQPVRVMGVGTDDRLAVGYIRHLSTYGLTEGKDGAQKGQPDGASPKCGCDPEPFSECCQKIRGSFKRLGPTSCRCAGRTTWWPASPPHDGYRFSDCYAKKTGVDDYPCTKCLRECCHDADWYLTSTPDTCMCSTASWSAMLRDPADCIADCPLPKKPDCPGPNGGDGSATDGGLPADLTGDTRRICKTDKDCPSGQFCPAAYGASTSSARCMPVPPSCGGWLGCSSFGKCVSDPSLNRCDYSYCCCYPTDAGGSWCLEYDGAKSPASDGSIAADAGDDSSYSDGGAGDGGAGDGGAGDGGAGDGGAGDGGKIPGFGDTCTSSKRCSGSLICLVASGASTGVCTSRCSSLGSTCAGTPTGTFAACISSLSGGGYACEFLCKASTSTWPCPSQLTCATQDSPPGSGQRLCEP